MNTREIKEYEVFTIDECEDCAPFYFQTGTITSKDWDKLDVIVREQLNCNICKFIEDIDAVDGEARIDCNTHGDYCFICVIKKGSGEALYKLVFDAMEDMVA
jgi:hypothetical protein